MRHNADLLDRLAAFQFDQPGAAFPFSARLTRDNGWSRDFTLRAIEEYRRFLYLAAISEWEMTPPETVDQVWHLHLVYTRSYWDDLCVNVLRRPLHHAPTNGGGAEDARFRSAYAATLRRYQEAFASAPPPDIWPDVEARFSPRTRRSRSRFFGWNHIVIAAAIIFPGMALAATGGASNSFVPVVMLGGFLLFVIGKWIWNLILGPDAPQRKGPDGTSGCGTGSIETGGLHHASTDSGSSDSASSDGSSGCGSSGCGGGGGD